MFIRALTILTLSVSAAGQNLVAHYKLDETSGTVAADSSGNGLDGVTQPTSSWVAGHVNGGIELSGMGHVRIPGSPVQGVALLTIAAWVNVNVFENWDGILTKGTGNSPYSLQLGAPDGRFKFTANAHSPPGGVGGGAFTSLSSLNQGQWHHLAVTFDGNEVRLYMDGLLDSAHPAPGTILGTTSQELIIGADIPGGDEFFDGILDDVRLYDGPLTPQQISDLYSDSIGTNYCISVVNSTGFASMISATGSTSISANDLVLMADNLPAQPGIFIAGPGQSQAPFFNGFLCVDPNGLQRFLNTTAPAGGVITEAVDYATSAAGGLNVVAGSSYNYQRWNRDPAGGGGNANFSNGLEVLHTP